MITTPSQVSFHCITNLFIVLFCLKIFFIFRERGREEERGRETLIGCLTHTPLPGTEPAHMPSLGTEPTTQACALTRYRTGDLSTWGTTPNQLHHTGQGYHNIFTRGRQREIDIVVGDVLVKTRLDARKESGTKEYRLDSSQTRQGSGFFPRASRRTSPADNLVFSPVKLREWTSVVLSY